MKRALIAILIVSSLPAAAWATPYDTFGMGPRAIAMGGAYAAVGGDTSALYYNTAALVRAYPFHIELGYKRGDMVITFNDEQADIDSERGVSFGAIVGKTVMNRRLRIAGSIYTPDDHFMRFMLPTRTSPYVLRYNNENHTQATLLGAGCEIFSWWSVGLGASFVSGNVGGVDFALYEDKPAEGNLTSRLAGDLVPNFGTMFTPTEWLTIGLAYRSKREQQLGLPNRIAFPELKVLMDNGIIVFHDGRLVLNVLSFTHFSPRQTELGVAVQPNERWLLSLDATHYAYSEMKTNVANSKAVMEGDFGEVFPTGPDLKIPKPKLHDIIGVAVGTEYAAVYDTVFKLHLRGGYTYRPTPAPEQSGPLNLYDSDLHIFSAGLGFTFAEFSKVFPAPISINIYDQFHYLEPRVMHKESATSDVGDVEFRGTANVIGGGFVLRFQ